MISMGGWGDNGSARPTTDAYRDNYDKIFNKEEKKDEKPKKPKKKRGKK